MSLSKKMEFEIIVEDILNNDKFKSLSRELHHGISRYEHSLRVAKYSYNVATILHMKNYKEITRAALLHDFYDDVDLGNDTPYERLYTHPHTAVVNAKKYFELNETQENIIESHMFPMSKTLPKSKEAVLVSLMDKSAATYEMAHFKLALKLSMLLIFLYNVITIEK